MSEMIAPCGLVCSQCPTFMATLNDDDEMRRKTAAYYAERFGFNLAPEQINCDGCLSEGGRLIGYCRTCGIRQCSRDKGLVHCAGCSEQPCDKMIAFHRFSPEVKASFEKMVAAGGGSAKPEDMA